MNGTNGHLDFTVNMIGYAADTVTVEASFRGVMEGVASARWANQVEAVRLAYANGGKKEADAPKKKLPGILFSGTFKQRSSSALIQHSGLICADLDDLGARLEAVFEHVSSDPHTLACFRSPTGSGLKVIFRCDPSRPHIDSFHACEHFCLETFGLQIDEKCSDVSRICFVSHDPEAFVADDAEPLSYPPAELVRPKEFKLPPRQPGSDLSPGDDFNARGGSLVPEILEAHGWTHIRGKYWTRPGKTGGPSASWEHYPNTLHIFSSSPETGFPSDRKGFDPFAVYCHLECAGDFHRAAKELAAKGYGTPARPSRQQQNLDRLSPLPETAQEERNTVQGERTEQTPDDGAPVGQGADEEMQASAPTEPVPAQAVAIPDDLEKRLITLSSAPTEPVTRLFLAGKPVCTPGNLTTLISKAKTGKTATIGAVVAAIIGAHHDRYELDTLKFTAPHTSDAVILIDTEQSPFDAYTCHKRMFARAQQAQDVSWLCHYSLVGYSAKQLSTTLPIILQRSKTAHGGVFTVILDGVADFVNSVNDEAECNGMVAWLRKLAVDYDCPIICVIHSNEAKMSGDDGRGHLGKQLTRKAESNLLLKKTGEVTVITSEKQRKAPITEADGVAFEWSDEHQRHTICPGGPITSKSGRPVKYDPDLMIRCVPASNEQPSSVNQILRIVKALPCGISPRGFADVVSKWVETGQVERVGDAKKGFYFKRTF